MGCGSVGNVVSNIPELFKGKPTDVLKKTSQIGLGYVGDMAKDQGAWRSAADQAKVDQQAADDAAAAQDKANSTDPYYLGTRSLKAQIDMAPAVYDANAKYQPMYADLSNKTLREQMLGSDGNSGLLSLYSDISPTLNKLTAEDNTASRTADIADVQNLGGAAVKAWQDANPQLQAAMAALQGKVDSAGTSTSIENELRSQAQTDLANGGKLSAEGQRGSQQSVRQAAADRGMVMSNQTIFDEALNSEKLRQDRLDNARTFAAGVDQIDTTKAQQNVSNYGTLANMYQSQAQDPYSLVLGRSTTPSLTQSTVSQASSQSTSPTLFDPFNSDIMSMYNTAYNANNAASISAGNNSSAQTGAMIGGGASIAAAAIIAL